MKHPEAKQFEVFITNSDSSGYSNIGWKTKRRGEIAYDKNGKVMPGLFPVFADKTEVQRESPRSYAILVENERKAVYNVQSNVCS